MKLDSGLLHYPVYKNYLRDFPGGPVFKNSPADAGDTGLIPGPGRSHMLQSNEACVTHNQSPRVLETVLCNKRSHHNKKPMNHNE